MKTWFIACCSFAVTLWSCESELPPPSMEKTLNSGDYIFVNKKDKDSLDRIQQTNTIGFDSSLFIQRLDSFVPTICQLKSKYILRLDTLESTDMEDGFYLLADSMSMAHRQTVVKYGFLSAQYEQSIYLEAFHRPDNAFANTLLKAFKDDQLMMFHPNVNNYLIRTPGHIFWFHAAFYFPPQNFKKIINLFKKCMTEKTITEQVY